ncbi:MFS transporter [Nonomuraea sediminis]|uniref:MFS transporter n=1 Tax=Nonomuraea sediminis TaxID=2835864 RepID=UPI001BDD18A6|nr:MFS transporter [Nonomuraea sediminis]
MRARKLGADFHKLWTASAVSNLGDGVIMVAGPLLLASLTGDPALVAGAVLAQQLPWLLFALISGAFVDRLDRQRLIVVVDVLRGAVMAALALSIALDAVTIPLVYAAGFLLGTGETLADTAAAARLPSIVPGELLSRANARLTATFLVINQFAAKPFGAWLFAVAAAAPFGLNAATFLLAAALVMWMRPIPRPPAERRSIRRDIAEGVRWLLAHRQLRTLAAVLCAMQVTFSAAFAAYVLYARQRLGLGPLGFGVLVTAGAFGGLFGTAAAARLESRFGPTALLRTGLVVECLTHLVLALTRSPWVAGATMAVFGVHAMVWGVVVAGVRQRAVPDRLQGRVGSVYSLFDVGGAALGTLLGGVLARGLGLTGPYWVAFGAMAVIIATAWKPLAVRSTGDRAARTG